MTQNNCTIILGMHKSGASALAGCLDLMGFNLGNARSPANQPNQPGSFENQDIVLAHDILLRDLACNWDMVGALPENWQQTDAAKKAEQTLTGILERQFLNQNDPFAIKDPRMCRLMPLWDRALKNLNIQPSIILLLRHPMEVAKSLNTQHSFDLLKGHLLWLVHNREGLAACKDHEHALVTFDQLLADPVTALTNTSGLTALSGIDPYRHAQGILSFIRPEFKNHHQAESEQIKNGLFRHYAWVYDQFRTLQAKKQHLLQNPPETGTTPEEISEFPLAVSESKSLPAADDRKNAAEVFDNLLNIIGRYEQKERDQTIRLQRRLLETTSAAETIYAQIFFPDTENQTYTPENSRKVLLAPEEWQHVTVEIPNSTALRTSPLCIAPLNTRGMVFISGIKLMNSATGQECWSSDQNFSGLSVEKDALVLAQKDTLQMAATGSEPRLLLSAIPNLPDTPMHLEFWIKPARKQTALHDHWQELKSKHNKLRKQTSDLEKQLETESQHKNQIQEQLSSLKSEYAQKKTELQKQIQEKDSSISKLDQQLKDKIKELENTQNEKSSLQKQLNELENRIQEETNQKNQIQNQLDHLKSESAQREENLQNQLQQKENSLSEALQNLRNKENALTDLQKQIQEKEQSISDLQTQIREKDTSNSELNQQLKDKTRELEDSHTEKSTLHRQISDLENRLETETQQKKQIQEEFNSLRSEYAQKEETLQKQIEDKDHNLSELQKQVQDKEQNISDLQAQIREKDNSISDLNQQLSSRSQELENQENLTRQYFQALADAEKEQENLRQEINNKDQELTAKQQELENLKNKQSQSEKQLHQRLEEKDSSLSSLQKQIQDKDQNLSKLQKQLKEKDNSVSDLNQQLTNKTKEIENQENLTRQYFQALAEAEEEQEKLRSKLRTLEKQNKDLNNRLKEINKQFNALLSSKRFRLGNAIGKYAGLLLFKRPGQPDSVTRIREKLKEPEKPQKSTTSQYTRPSDSGRELVRSMDRLHNLFQVLMRSRRWKTGNTLVTIASALTLRFKKPNSINRMQKIFAEFQEWRKTVNPDFLSLEEIKQIRRWMHSLETDFKAVLASRRLRLGNTLAAPAKLLRWREKRPKATDRMKEIFEQHKHG